MEMMNRAMAVADGVGCACGDGVGDVVFGQEGGAVEVCTFCKVGGYG